MIQALGSTMDESMCILSTLDFLLKIIQLNQVDYHEQVGPTLGVEQQKICITFKK
jgi:hypothetical protein